MSHGDRAKKVGSVTAWHDEKAYTGKRPGNKGWAQHPARRAHKAAGGPSAKTITHRVERRQGRRDAQLESKDNQTT